MQVKETSNRGGASRWAGRALALLVALLVLGGPLAVPAEADFTLYNNEQITVSTAHTWGWLYDQSGADIVSGAYVEFLRTYDSSTVDISGGEVVSFTLADSSTANVSGGSVTNYLAAWQSSAVDISGGTIKDLPVYGFANVNISGGTVGTLLAYESSTVVFDGRDFQLSGGLSLDGDRVLGTGRLAGVWLDGTPWATDIYGNHGETVIRIIPEPATLALLGLGLAGLLRRRRTPCPVGGRR